MKSSTRLVNLQLGQWEGKRLCVAFVFGALSAQLVQTCALSSSALASTPNIIRTA